MASNGVDRIGVWREGMLYLTNTLSGVGEVYQTAFYGLPSDVPVVGVWREGMLYLTNTLSGVGEVYQTAFYGLPSDVSVVGVWRELSADQLPPPVVCALPQCPWGGTYLPSTDECQYTFNAQQRKAAAEWAISWAGKACPLFCAFDFHPYVTGAPGVNYACAGMPSTDCANFVSQAYFYAGLPMNLSWFCESNSQFICQRGIMDGYPQGWAYADRNNGMPDYFAQPHPKGLNGLDTYNIVRGTATPELVTTVQKGLSSYPRPGLFNYPILSLTQAPMPGAMRSEIGSFMRLLDSWGIGQGDVMYTIPPPDKPNDDHVFIIVGWGPYVETWEQLSQVKLSDITHVRSESNPVLYVVDHGPHGQYVLNKAKLGTAVNYAEQLKGLKPCYAHRWPERADGEIWVAAQPIHFVKVSSQVVLPYTSIVSSNSQQAFKISMPTVCPPQTAFPPPTTTLFPDPTPTPTATP